MATEKTSKSKKGRGKKAPGGLLARDTRKGRSGKFSIKDGVGRLTLNDLDLEIEFKVSDASDQAVANIRQFVAGPRPDSGAGDVYAWHEGDIRIAEED